MSKRDVYSKYKDKLRKRKQLAYCFGGKEVVGWKYATWQIVRMI